MIKTVTDSPEGPGRTSQADTMIPVTAEDVAREKRRRILKWGAVLGAIAVAGGLLYKHSMDPLRAQEAYDAGGRFLERADYAAAILNFDRAISLKSGFAQAYLMRGKTFLADGQTDRAIDDYTRVVQLLPSDTQGLLERGEVYLELKKFPQAVSDASKAIEINPKLAPAYNLRGMTLNSMGKPAQALADFNRAVELAPKADNYFQRGVVYQALGQHALAIKDFDQVIEFRPDGASAYYARAESRRAVGDVEGAKRDHQQARVLDGR